MLQQVLVLKFACLNPQHFIFEHSSIKYLVSERDKLIDQYREAKGKLILNTFSHRGPTPHVNLVKAQ